MRQCPPPGLHPSGLRRVYYHHPQESGDRLTRGGQAYTRPNLPGDEGKVRWAPGTLQRNPVCDDYLKGHLLHVSDKTDMNGFIFHVKMILFGIHYQ